MRMLSWNLFGLSDDALDVRTEAAMFQVLLGGRPEVVLASPDRPPPAPEILLFQEVVERTLHAHLRPHLTAAGYSLVVGSTAEREYFEVVALRDPFRIVGSSVERLESAMGRELVAVEAEADGTTWLVLTAHLESMQEGATLRMEQSRHVLDRIAAHKGPAVFGGDTNLRVAEADSLGVLPDAWEASGAKVEERWTRISTSGRRARYDRIWGRGVRFSGFHCIGREPVTPQGAPPSDHYGVVTTLRAV
jgi:endonuclease/exonuclease/phosphatase (EEP) superfamily protein YafD